MKKIFLILGRTAAGKSVITKAAAEKLDLKILKSYATRQPRANEINGDSDHIFISPDEVERYRDDMVAYFKREDAELFATKSQLLDSDFYIINPDGAKNLKKLCIPDVKFIEVYIRSPRVMQRLRYLQRGEDSTAFSVRYNDENAQFLEYEKEAKFDYHILNDGTIDEAVQKLCNIVQKELSHGN